jgi:hypothetical protein
MTLINETMSLNALKLMCNSSRVGKANVAVTWSHPSSLEPAAKC